MTDHDDHDSVARAQTRRKFLTGAGLAAGAAGAASLLGATPASATTPATAEVDLTSVLQWADISTVPWVLHPVDLGGGFAKGVFSAFGDMAALSLRVLVGDGMTLDTGTGPWVFDGVDMPSGYEPATPPNDVYPAGTPGWGGTAMTTDYTNVTHNTYELTGGWSNFTNVGQGTLMVWSLPNEHNTFMGNVLFNFNGDVPFGSTLSPGATLITTLVYLRAIEEP